MSGEYNDDWNDEKEPGGGKEWKNDDSKKGEILDWKTEGEAAKEYAIWVDDMDYFTRGDTEKKDYKWFTYIKEAKHAMSRSWEIVSLLELRKEELDERDVKVNLNDAKRLWSRARQLVEAMQNKWQLLQELYYYGQDKGYLKRGKLFDQVAKGMIGIADSVEPLIREYIHYKDEKGIEGYFQE